MSMKLSSCFGGCTKHFYGFGLAKEASKGSLNVTELNFPPLNVQLYKKYNFSYNVTDDPAKVEDIFEIHRLIGHGGYGKVWLTSIRGRQGVENLALKQISSATSSVEMANIELHVLKLSAGFPFIIQLHSCFHTPTDYYIVMQYAPGGTLHQKVRCLHFSELIARFYSAEIALALFFLHEQHIVHRDMNMDNVFLGHDGHVLVGDFGLCYISNEDEQSPYPPWECCGAPEYPAPELLMMRPFDKTVDWWSFGVMLYRMICSKWPFPVLTGKPSPTRDSSADMMYRKEIYPPRISPQAKTFLSMLLAKNARSRIGRGPNEERDITSVDFFKTVEWPLLRTKSIPAPFTSSLICRPTRGKRMGLSI